MLNHVDADFDQINLEGILTTQISNTEPEAFSQALTSLNKRNAYVNRDLFGWATTVGKGIAWPFMKANTQGKTSHEKAMAQLDEIARYTIDGSTSTGTGPTATSSGTTTPTGVPTHHAVEAMILKDYVQAKVDVIDGNLEGARTNLTSARGTLETYLSGHAKLTTLLQFNDALVTMKMGDFDSAYTTLKEGKLATNSEASYVRGIIKSRQGNFAEAEKDLRISYQENPHREAVRQGLAKVYDNLAFTVTAEPTEVYTPIPQNVRTDFEAAKTAFSNVESKRHYTGNDFDDAKTKFEAIDSGIDTPNDAGKAMKARVKHYLANIEIAKGNLITADKLLQESIAIVPSSKAYECLSYVFNNMKTA